MTKSMKLDGSNLPQFIMEMKGKRLFSSWGSLKITSKEVETVVVEGDEDEENFELEYYGFLPDVIKDAILTGDTFSQRALGLAVKERVVDVELFQNSVEAA
jgi:hypothetical protein